MTIRARTAAGLALLALLVAAAPAAEARTPRGFHGAFWDVRTAAFDTRAQSRHWSLMARSGVESVRTVFFWSLMQPVRGGPIDFSSTDRLVEMAARRRIELLPVVMYAPEWARRDPALADSPPADPADYAAFIAEVVRRYGPRGSFWRENRRVPRRSVRRVQVWNEPQLQYQWNTCAEGTDRGGCPGWQAEYGALLRAAYPAVRAADRSVQVVLAGLTNRSWDALASLYRQGGIRGNFDVAAVHAYTGSPRRVVEILRRYRRVLRANGGRRTPLWLTELGWPAARGRANVPPGLRSVVTTDRGMARRLRSAYRLLARRPSGVTRVFWQSWASSYAEPDDVFSYGGLVRSRGSSIRRTPSLTVHSREARRARGCRRITSRGTCVRRR